jgi:hypothetical protein
MALPVSSLREKHSSHAGPEEANAPWTDPRVCEMRRSHRRQKSFGSLQDNLLTVANRVCSAMKHPLVTVWVGDQAEVYADRKDVAEGVAAHCLVGIYSMGMKSSDIVDDLLEVRRERLRMGILDD